MHVISRAAIDEAIRRQRDADKWLNNWWRIAKAERWSSIHDVQAVYPRTDQVSCCLVFNVRGNKYRLVVRVAYANEWSGGTLWIKHFLTHAEYDKNEWKGDCV